MGGGGLLGRELCCVLWVCKMVLEWGRGEMRTVREFFGDVLSCVVVFGIGTWMVDCPQRFFGTVGGACCLRSCLGVWKACCEGTYMFLLPTAGFCYGIVEINPLGRDLFMHSLLV